MGACSGFNGTSSDISVPLTNQPNSSIGTYAMWVYVDDNGADNCFWGLTAGNLYFFKQSNSNSSVRINWATFSAAGAANSFTDNEWHFVLTDSDATSSCTTTCWVDDMSSSACSQGGVNPVSLPDPTKLGRLNSGSGQWLNGYMAYVQVFNRRLTTNEKNQIKIYPGSIRDGLVSYYPLIEPQADFKDLGSINTSLTGANITETFSSAPPIVSAFL